MSDILGYLLPENLRVIDTQTIQYQEQRYVLSEDFAFKMISIKDVPCTTDIDEFYQFLERHHINIKDINESNWLEIDSVLDTYTLKNNLHHYLYEQNRIKQALQLIQSNQVEPLGRLMYQSYDSFKNMFGLTSQPQDYLMILAKKHQLLGANISGSELVCFDRVSEINEKVKLIFDDFQQIYQKGMNEDD